MRAGMICLGHDCWGIYLRSIFFSSIPYPYPCLPVLLILDPCSHGKPPHLSLSSVHSQRRLRIVCFGAGFHPFSSYLRSFSRREFSPSLLFFPPLARRRRFIPPGEVSISLYTSFLLLVVLLRPLLSFRFSPIAAMSAGNSLLPRAAYKLTPEQQAAKDAAEAVNEKLTNYLMIVCGAVSVAVIIWKVCERIIKLTRHVSCLHNDKQRYFAIPSPNISALKRHLLYAPVFSKRHNREIQLSRAINVGTLPSRFQLLFLIAYFASNVAWCVVDIPFDGEMSAVANVVRNRTGVLSTVNMVWSSCQVNEASRSVHH